MQPIPHRYVENTSSNDTGVIMHSYMQLPWSYKLSALYDQLSLPSS